MGKINSFPNNMTLREVVLCAILFKPGDKRFLVNALEYGLKNAENKPKRLEVLFRSYSSDQEKTNVLNSILSFASMGNILASASDMQYDYMTKAGKEHIKMQIAGYDAKVIRNLKNLAGKVWQKAGEYKSIYNLESLYH